MFGAERAGWLERFGRHEFAPMDSGIDADTIWPTIVELHPVATADPAGFVAELVDVALATGGWATYGGHRLVHELLGTEYEDERYLVLFDAAMAFLRLQGYGWERLAPYEADRLRRRNGD